MMTMMKRRMIDNGDYDNDDDITVVDDVNNADCNDPAQKYDRNKRAHF